MKIVSIICGITLCLAPVTGQSQTVLAFPENAIQKVDIFQDASSYQLPLSSFDNGVITTETAEGRIVQQVWRTSGEQIETLDLLAPLRKQLYVAGFDILFECETRGCGGFDFRFKTDVVAEPDMHVDLGDFRFLSAKRQSGDTPEYISLLVSRSADYGYVQVTSVGTPLAGKAAVSVSTSQTPSIADSSDQSATIAERIVENGSVVLEGLNFANGASTPDKDSLGSLQELAFFLSENPLLSVVLVGHTDASGALSKNVALSRKRANSILLQLVEIYDIDPARLTAEGVGYLAPRASNDTENGRSLNRRVEVILTPDAPVSN